MAHVIEQNDKGFDREIVCIRTREARLREGRLRDRLSDRQTDGQTIN